MPKYHRRTIPEISESLADHFWGKVDIRTPEECWLWKAGAFNRGYGAFAIGYSQWPASRIAFVLQYGAWAIPGNIFVLHRCDNPLCCNPDHLFIGTAKENAEDCVGKDRSARGERHTLAKLSEEKVITIRSLIKNGEAKPMELARRYGVDIALISRVVRRKSWAHVE